mgnify:CR=1 FL=1
MQKLLLEIFVVIANDEIKKCDGSEDEIKDGQNRVQKLTDKFVKEIDEIGKAKEKDIMTV